MRRMSHLCSGITKVLFLVWSSAQAQTPAVPDCWPAQIGGTGSVAVFATNTLGWTAYWECSGSTNSPYLLWGHWSEMATNWRTQFGNMTTTNAATRWTAGVSNATGDLAPGGKYFDLAPLVKGLGNKMHPGLWPLFAAQGADVFSPIKTKETVSMVRVGSMTALTQCDSSQQFSLSGVGYAVVPDAAVTLVNSSQPTALVAACY